MDLSEHLQIIWRRKLRVVGIALVLAGIVYLHSNSLPDLYTSDALLTVTSARSGESGGQEDTLFLAKTYARLGDTRPIVADAVERSGLDISVGEGLHRIGLSAASDVGFITVSANGPTPDEAQKLAAAEADALVAAVDASEEARANAAVAKLQPEIDAINRQLEQLPASDPQRAGLQSTLQALITQKAQIEVAPRNEVRKQNEANFPGEPISPTPKRDAVLALFIALILNAELMVLLEILADRFGTDDITRAMQAAVDLPVLAEVPRNQGPATIEAFRTLRTNLVFLNSGVPLRTLAIVGVEPGSGKSHTAIGLATSTADLELPVVLVDADLRRPVIHQRLGLPIRPGLGDLRSRDDLNRVVQPVAGHPFLKVIAAGSTVDDPSGLLSGGFRQVMGLITADLVVVDTPAAGMFAEATAIAAQCDATVVVLDAKTTRRRALVKLVENLRRVGANPVGVVLNRVDLAPRSNYASYSKYSRSREAARSAGVG